MVVTTEQRRAQKDPSKKMIQSGGRTKPFHTILPRVRVRVRVDRCIRNCPAFYGADNERRECKNASEARNEKTDPAITRYL